MRESPKGATEDRAYRAFDHIWEVFRQLADAHRALTVRIKSLTDRAGTDLRNKRQNEIPPSEEGQNKRI